MPSKILNAAFFKPFFIPIDSSYLHKSTQLKFYEMTVKVILALIETSITRVKQSLAA